MAPPSTAQQYVAAHSELIIAWWRDWVRFIEARRTLNALQQQRIDGTATALADAFDQQQARVSVESQERQATATINRIPAPRRAVFEAELTDRVAQAQEGAGAEAAADRLTLERQVLDEFLALAHGRGTTGPDAERAAVPCEGRVWFSFPPEVIDALPAEDAYGLAGTTTRRGLRLRVIGFVVALLAMGAVWFASTRAWGQERLDMAAPQPVAQVNGAPFAPWPIRAVVIGTTTLPVARIDAAAWPAAPAETAGWRSDQVWPVVICVPAPLTAPLPATITLFGGGTGALDRTFRLAPVDAARRPDLRLVACGGNDTPLAIGILQDSAPPARAELGTLQSIPQLGDLRLTAVQVTMPAQDATIAEGRARIQLTLVAPAALDWPAWRPVLRFLDGSEARTAAVQPMPDGMITISYDIETASLSPPGDALWQITAPSDDGMGATYRWRIALPAPPEVPAVSRHEPLTIGYRVSAIEERG